MKKVLGLVGLLVALGALAVAQAGSKGQVRDPSYQGTIAVSDGDGEMNEEMEAQSYAGLAKISPEEATRAAQMALGTQAAPTKVRLGNENGYLVYEVVIGNQEVKVDAGSGKVLHKEPLGHEEGSEDGGQDGEQDGE